MKIIEDNKPYHVMGSFMNSYHIEYRRRQVEEFKRNLFRKNPEAWRRMMRNKLHKKTVITQERIVGGNRKNLCCYMSLL